MIRGFTAAAILLAVLMLAGCDTPTETDRTDPPEAAIHAPPLRPFQPNEGLLADQRQLAEQARERDPEIPQQQEQQPDDND